MTIPAATELIARAVILRDDHILLARQHGKTWFFLPGGHIEPGERIEPALSRELHEELGVTADITGFAGAVEHAYAEDGTAHHELNLVFTACIPNTPPTSREEHLEFTFLPLGDIPSADLRPSTLKNALGDWLTDRRPFWQGYLA